jgi:hypothetical protein
MFIFLQLLAFFHALRSPAWENFIGSEDNNLMPTGGTGFNTGLSLGEPVLHFSGQPPAVHNVLFILG